jgi:hypothetical protein
VARQGRSTPLVEAAQVQRALRAVDINLESVLPEDVADLVDDPAVTSGKQRVVERRRFDRAQIPQTVLVVVATQQPAAEIEEMHPRSSSTPVPVSRQVPSQSRTVPLP